MIKIQLLESNEIIEGKNANEIVMKLGLLDREEYIEDYLYLARKRFKLAFGIDLFFNDSESFIKAIDSTGKYFKIIK